MVGTLCPSASRILLAMLARLRLVYALPLKGPVCPFREEVHLCDRFRDRWRTSLNRGLWQKTIQSHGFLLRFSAGGRRLLMRTLLCIRPFWKTVLLILGSTQE